MESVKKYINNKKRGKTSCEMVLGTFDRIVSLSRVLDDLNDDIQIVLAANLLEYANTQNYTKEEMQAYRLGLYTLYEFIKQCKEEVEYKKEMDRLEEEQKRKPKAY